MQVREQVCERMEVHDADDTTWGQSIGNSPVHRGDLSGGDKPQETANTGPDGNCIRGDRAAYHGAGCNPAQGDPQALGAIAGLVAMLAAVIAGWWHTRSLKHASTGTSEPPVSKP